MEFLPNDTKKTLPTPALSKYTEALFLTTSFDSDKLSCH